MGSQGKGAKVPKGTSKKVAKAFGGSSKSGGGGAGGGGGGTGGGGGGGGGGGIGPAASRCQHQPCKCMSSLLSDYCSDYCANAKGGGRCRCEHPECR